MVIPGPVPPKVPVDYREFPFSSSSRDLAASARLDVVPSVGALRENRVYWKMRRVVQRSSSIPLPIPFLTRYTVEISEGTGRR